MPRTVKIGLVLGLLLGGLWLALVAAGPEVYMNTLLNLWLILALEVAGLAWALWRLGGGKRYWGRVVAGLVVFAMLTLVGTVATYVGWTVVAPDYGEVAVGMARERLVSAHPELAAGEVEARLAGLREMYSPSRQTFFYLVTTLLTGIVLSPILAGLIRPRLRA